MSRNDLAASVRPSITRLVIADVDNLVGDPAANQEEHTRLWRIIRGQAIRFDEHTRTVAAATSLSAMPAFCAMASEGVPAQRLVRNGKDGADLALLESVDIDHLVRCGLREVVLATGDGIFTDLALALRARGIKVILLLGRGAPARRLLEACPMKMRLRLDGRSSLWSPSARRVRARATSMISAAPRRRGSLVVA